MKMGCIFVLNTSKFSDADPAGIFVRSFAGAFLPASERDARVSSVKSELEALR